MTEMIRVPKNAVVYQLPTVYFIPVGNCLHSLGYISIWNDANVPVIDVSMKHFKKHCRIICRGDLPS